MKIKLNLRTINLILLLFANQAFAELGGNTASVEADRVHMKAAVRILPAQKYAVHEIQLDSGTTVREYVSPGGKVFAVAWNGPHMPDLRQLFGGHFETFQMAAKTKRSGHGPLLINRSDLVVHSGGHRRAFSGVAYLPQLMPGDVAVTELK